MLLVQQLYSSKVNPPLDVQLAVTGRAHTEATYKYGVPFRSKLYKI